MNTLKVKTLDVQNVFANQMTSKYSAKTSHAAVAPTVEATEATATEDPTTEVLAVEPTEVPASEATQKPKKAKKQQAITENQFNAQTDSFKSAADFVGAACTADYDGKSLEEDKVYHIQKMKGLRLYAIKANRRTYRRALKMLDACTSNGMTTPAIVVDAKVVRDWGLRIVDPLTLEEVNDNDLDGAYCLMEGHGRFHAYLLSVALAKTKGGEPFDFHFVYKHYDTPEAFGNAYVSTNADMTRTTHKDRLGIAGERSNNPLVKAFIKKNQEDHVLAKAAYFWTYGRELSKTEVTAITYDAQDAPTFDEDITVAMEGIYEAFKAKFAEPGAAKIYRGTFAAKWCAQRIKDADNKLEEADKICKRVTEIDISVYTAIVTASSNSKKHLRREDLIVAALEKMME
ncbi:MAG: hypothetical protein KBS82_06640 [Oscillospiraceae bacterium]|nr:hypothetical protein [Candidatus Limimonas egerieequi]